MDGTPIFDIKPYVSLSDCHPEARCGFVDSHAIRRLSVTVPSHVRRLFTEEQLLALVKVLELDPRPHYHNDPSKTYGMPYAGRDVKFRVEGDRLLVVDA